MLPCGLVLPFLSGDKYNADTGKPKLNQGQVCFKFTLLSMNVLFLIFGAVLMGVGSYAINNTVGSIAGTTIPIGLIVLGVFIMLLSILGALSAWRESRAFLGIYFVFLLIFTIILFAVGIAVYVERDNASSILTSAWNSASTDVQSTIQSTLSCCGLTAVPANYTGCPSDDAEALTRACLPVMVDLWESSFTTAGACGIAFSVIMLAGLIFICYLMTGIKRKQQEHEIARLRTGGDHGLGSIEVDEEAPIEHEQVALDEEEEVAYE